MHGIKVLMAKNYIQGIQVLELANRAYDLYLQQPHEARAKLLHFLLSNAVLNDGNLWPTYRKPFDILANRGQSSTKASPRGFEPLLPA